MENLAFFPYLVRMVAIGIATGTVFLRLGLFPGVGRGQIILLGLCASPMIASMMNYLLGLVFIGWPSWFFFATPLLLAIVWILQGKNRAVLQLVCREDWTELWKEISSFGKWGSADFAVAMGLVAIFASKYYCYDIIFSIKQFVAAHAVFKYTVRTILVAGVFYAGRYYERWGKNRLSFFKQIFKEIFLKHVFVVAFFSVVGSAVLAGSIYGLYPIIEADRSHYELNAQYFLESKNSWEIDNYTDERKGSSLRDDHGPLWITMQADPRIIADAVGVNDALRVSNFSLFWIYLCFNFMLVLVTYRVSKTPKAGIMALLLLGLYIYEKNFLLLGARDAFRFIGLLLLFFYAGTIFHVIVANRAKWIHYAFLAFCCWLSVNGHEGNVFIMLGLFLSMLILLVVNRNIKAAFLCGVSALLGTVVGITKTISIYLETGRLSSSTSLPFHGTPVIEMLRQVSLMRGDWGQIWASYRLPEFFLMGLGLFGLLVMLVEAQRKKNKDFLIWGMLVLGMLLPLSGGMDWIGYECSRWFFEQLRYRMYFFVLFAIMGGWLLTYQWKWQCGCNICSIIIVMVFGWWVSVECQKYAMNSVGAVVSGQKCVEQYKIIADKVNALSNGKAFVGSQSLLYYLTGRPKLLFHMYSEPLIQAKTYNDCEVAMETLNIGAIILPQNGCDYHDYSLLPFWDYIQEEFICLSSGDFGQYVIFLNPALIKEGAF